MVSSDASFSAGTYNLSESGGPLGYAASAWVCAGGTQVDQDTVTIAVGQAVTCTITNDDFPADSTINAGHAGGWFNPETSGQGVLIDIDPVDQFIFLAWFTYTDKLSALPDEQHWYTAQGNYSGNRADLILHETLGGAFDAPEPVSTEPVGEVTLEFTGCTDLLMSYSIDTELLVGAIPMKRLIPGSENLCAQLAGNQTQAVDINAGMDGAWYEQATAGQGFLIDAYPDPENGNFIFVAWFTYGDDTGSGQRWLTAQGEFEGSTAVMEINETTGGSFDDPQVPSTVPVGSMAIDFDDCSNATLSYDLTDESLTGEIPLTRVLANAAGLCEELTE